MFFHLNLCCVGFYKIFGVKMPNWFEKICQFFTCRLFLPIYWRSRGGTILRNNLYNPGHQDKSVDVSFVTRIILEDTFINEKLFREQQSNSHISRIHNK